MSSRAETFISIPSQQSLLERLRYLTEYGDHLLLVHGAPGTGKSTIVRQLVETADGFNKAVVVAPVDNNESWLRQQLVQQLVSEAVFDPSDPILDTLERVLTTSGSRVLIALDEVQRLSDALIAEIVALAMAQSKQLPKITVVLGADEGLAKRLFAELPETYKSKLLPVELGPLPQEERYYFYRQLQRHYVGGLGISAVNMKARLAKMSGTVGAIKALFEPNLSSVKPKRQIDSRLLLLGFASVGLLSGLIWWLNLPQQQEQPEALGPETEIVAEHAPTSSDAEPASPDAENQPSNLGLAKPWQPDSTALRLVEPKENEDAKVDLIDEQQVLEVTASPELVPDDSNEDQEESAEPSTDLALEIDSNISESKRPDTESDLASQNEGMSPVEFSEQAIPNVQSGEPEQLVPASLFELPLNERPLDSFVIQIAVFSQPRFIPEFLAKHSLEERIRFYRVEREPGPWFVLVYGGFASQAEAEQNNDTLRSSGLQSFVKSVDAVRREMSAEITLADLLAQ